MTLFMVAPARALGASIAMMIVTMTTMAASARALGGSIAMGMVTMIETISGWNESDARNDGTDA
jgi:hypothetical protein